MFTYAAHADKFVLSSFVPYVKKEIFSERSDSSRRDSSAQCLQPTVDVRVIHMCMCVDKRRGTSEFFLGWKFHTSSHNWWNPS